MLFYDLVQQLITKHTTIYCDLISIYWFWKVRNHKNHCTKMVSQSFACEIRNFLKIQKCTVTFQKKKLISGWRIARNISNLNFEKLPGYTATLTMASISDLFANSYTWIYSSLAIFLNRKYSKVWYLKNFPPKINIPKAGLLCIILAIQGFLRNTNFS